MEEQKYLITDHTFIRFTIIGVISNVINFTLYALTYLVFVNIIISSLIGYFIGILTSYYFGRLWVFKVDNNFRLSEIIRFVSVYVIGGLGMTIIIFCLDYYLNFDYRLSWIVGALFAITNNYLGSKHLVFSKKDI